MAEATLYLPKRDSGYLFARILSCECVYEFYADNVFLGSKRTTTASGNLITWDCPGTTGLDGNVTLKAKRWVDWTADYGEILMFGPFDETTVINATAIQASTWQNIRDVKANSTSLVFDESTITNIIYTEGAIPLQGSISASGSVSAVFAIQVPLAAAIAASGALQAQPLTILWPPIALEGIILCYATLTAGTLAIVAPPPEPPARISLTGMRLERYVFELVQRDGSYVGELRNVLEGELEHNVFTELRHAGRITITRDVPIDWLDPRIRITYYNGTDAYPLGTFIGSTPTRSTDGMSETIEVELYSMLLVLAQDVFPHSFTLQPGENVTQAVKQLIADAGLVPVVTDSNAVLPVAMTWHVGTSRLKVINDLLAAINYFSVDTDEFGHVVAAPYRAPSEREPVRVFEPGEVAIHKPQFSVQADYYSMPNRIIAVAGNDEHELVAVAEDYDSPVGRTTRGRWVSEVRDNLDAVDEDTLRSIAERLLAEARQVIETVEGLEHAYVPLALNDVVVVRDDVLGIDTRYSISAWRHRLCDLGATVSSTARRVVA